MQSSKESKLYSEIVNDSFQTKTVDGSLRVGGFSKVNELYVEADAIISEFCNFKRCRLGRFFACGNFCSATDVTFGDFVSVGDQVLFNAGMHPKDKLTTHLFKFNPSLWGLDRNPDDDYYKWRTNLSVGSDVWIGSHSIVLTGVSIGDGAIVGANSLVNRDVPPYAICAGSPGKIIGYRFEPEIIRKLVQLRWWGLPMDQILQLPLNDIGQCLSMLERFRNQVPPV